MPYPPPRYLGETGKVSARLVPASAAPNTHNMPRADTTYLATGPLFTLCRDQVPVIVREEAALTSDAGVQAPKLMIVGLYVEIGDLP